MHAVKVSPLLVGVIASFVDMGAVFCLIHV
jgi:hypothetical protein